MSHKWAIRSSRDTLVELVGSQCFYVAYLIYYAINVLLHAHASDTC